MTKIQMAVGGQAGSSLNSPEFQKIYKKGFSIAEALVALLIGSLILGMSAPLITKQLKHNTFTDVQAQLLNRKVEDVKDVTNTNTNNIASILNGRDVATYVQYIQTLENKINRLENAVDNEKIQNIINGKTEQKNYDNDISSLKSQNSQLQSSLTTLNQDMSNLEDDVSELEEQLNKRLVPKNSIMFFEGNCPSGWTDMSSSYAGRYVRLAGTYNICDKDGEDTNGACVKSTATVSLVPKTKQGESNRRITGTLPGVDADVGGYYSYNDYIARLKYYGFLGGAFDFVKSSELTDKNSPFKFPSNWASLHWKDVASYAKMYDTGYTYLLYTDPALLTDSQSTGAYRWFLNSIDTKRVLPTDTTYNETRPKTIVLRACMAPSS